VSTAAVKSAAASVIAVAALLIATANLGAAEFDKYVIESASVSLSSNQAGAHADLTTTFSLSEKGGQPYANTRDLTFKLPPGAIGNPQSIETCSIAALGNDVKESNCPRASQIGITEVRVGEPLNGTFIEPLYNMDPPESGDIIARFGFFAGLYPSFVNVRVDPQDYSVEATLEGIPSAASLIRATSTIWGVPAAKVHDNDRLTPEEAFHGEKPSGVELGIPEKPFLSNPTDCSAARQLTLLARSYQQPDVLLERSAPFPQIGGCGKLAFSPRFTIQPTNPEAFAPTGIDADLEIPQDETPQGRSTSALKSAVVSLPPGFAINPAAGDGQQACSSEQVAFGERRPASCPGAAKIGSVEVDVPALPRTLNGSVFLRTPEPGHLFRFWVVTDEQGVYLKLPAEIQLDPVTGQVTTVFSGLSSLGGLPQVPFSDLRLHVTGGPRGPIATPGCGTYQTHFRFVPWSGNPAVEGQTPMDIVSGCGKGGFSPALSAGTLSTAAGSFSPFTMTLTRQDGEANLQALSVHLPKGLTAKLAGVPLCPEAAAATADCPEGSKLGSVTAASGVGGAPLWIPQPGKAPTAIYLAGPYKGAPYSVSIRVPAQAGPFDLGTVVTRAGLYVDPETATATIKSDPLPQILEGVPIAYRTINAIVDRPDFTLNATGCNRREIQAHVVAANSAVADPVAPYQATDCGVLAYTPKLKLSLKGATKRTGHPAASAVLTQPKGQSNSAKATALLPASQFIDQDHINNPCTRVQFNAGNCPPLSILGKVTATTPLLDRPLKGNIYFRSNGGERELPDIVADLNGQIHATTVGFIDSVPIKGTERARLRVRFASIPDAPLSKVTMHFFGGPKRGLLENSRNLCGTNRRAQITMVAQNGLTRRTSQVIATSCQK
jgi:hypothetical protein